MIRKIKNLVGLAAVVSCVALPGQMSQALMIGFNVQPSGPESLCYLNGHNAASTMSYRCSGTLISPDMILTAAHCVAPLEQPKMGLDVYCGFAGTRTPTIGTSLKTLIGMRTEASPVFREKMQVAAAYINPRYNNKASDTPDDYAIIQLSKPSKLRFTEVLSPSQSTNLLMHLNDKNPQVQCMGTGFGIDAQDRVGSLQTGDMTRNLRSGGGGVLMAQLQMKLTSILDIARWLTFEDEQRHGMDIDVKEALFLNQRKLINTSLMPGDSGGPLLCRENSKATWKTVAVASVIGFQAQGFTKENSLVVGEEILWSMPNLTNALMRTVWKANSTPTPEPTPAPSR